MACSVPCISILNKGFSGHPLSSEHNAMAMHDPCVSSFPSPLPLCLCSPPSQLPLCLQSSVSPTLVSPVLRLPYPCVSSLPSPLPLCLQSSVSTILVSPVLRLHYPCVSSPPSRYPLQSRSSVRCFNHQLTSSDGALGRHCGRLRRARRERVRRHVRRRVLRGAARSARTALHGRGRAQRQLLPVHGLVRTDDLHAEPVLRLRVRRPPSWWPRSSYEASC